MAGGRKHTFAALPRAPGLLVLLTMHCSARAPVFATARNTTITVTIAVPSAVDQT